MYVQYTIGPLPPPPTLPPPVHPPPPPNLPSLALTLPIAVSIETGFGKDGRQRSPRWQCLDHWVYIHSRPTRTIPRIF